MDKVYLKSLLKLVVIMTAAVIAALLVKRLLWADLLHPMFEGICLIVLITVLFAQPAVHKYFLNSYVELI